MPFKRSQRSERYTPRSGHQGQVSCREDQELHRPYAYCRAFGTRLVRQNVSEDAEGALVEESDREFHLLDRGKHSD